jgi:hypothetical protein
MKMEGYYSYYTFALKLRKVVRCCAVLLAAWFLVGTPGTNLLSSSAAAAEEGKKEETLTNKSIIELQQLNLGDAVILEKIKASKCDFDVSLAGLKELKAAKVSDVVIQTMISPKSSTAGGAAEPAAAGDINDPNAAHELGVWLYEEAGGQKKMTKVEGENYRIWAGAGPFGGSTRAVLAGIKSPLQVSSSRPVFYMYFGQGGQGIMGTMNPNEMPLAKLDLKEKTKERLLIIGSVAPFAGYNSGIKRESLRAIESVNVFQGIYKVTPSEDLVEGEYAFCHTATGGLTTGKMFCFGVHPK